MEVTIEITQYCPYYCDYCSSNASPKGKHLSYNKIEEFLKSVNDIVTRINISGGEPLAHPRFYDILMMCYSITDDVRIYTNMIKYIIFNSDIIDDVKVEANVCVISGRSIYIPDVDKVHLLKLVNQGRAINFHRKNITVSHNFKASDNVHDCKVCNHILLQSDGKIVDAPCKKDYEIA